MRQVIARKLVYSLLSAVVFVTLMFSSRASVESHRWADNGKGAHLSETVALAQSAGKGTVKRVSVDRRVRDAFFSRWPARQVSDESQENSRSYFLARIRKFEKKIEECRETIECCKRRIADMRQGKRYHPSRYKSRLQGDFYVVLKRNYDEAIEEYGSMIEDEKQRIKYYEYKISDLRRAIENLRSDFGPQ